MMRLECFNCNNQIETEGDAFCKECEPNFGLTDDGDVYELNPKESK